MLSPIRQKFFKTVEDVFKSDYKFSIFSYTYTLYKDDPKYQEMFKNNRIDYTDAEKILNMVNDDFFSQNKVVAEIDCKEYKMEIERRGDGKSLTGFYLVNDPIFSKPTGMVFNPMNPYLGRFQGKLSHSKARTLPIFSTVCHCKK